MNTDSTIFRHCYFLKDAAAAAAAEQTARQAGDLRFTQVTYEIWDRFDPAEEISVPGCIVWDFLAGDPVWQFFHLLQPALSPAALQQACGLDNLKVKGDSPAADAAATLRGVLMDFSARDLMRDCDMTARAAVQAAGRGLPVSHACCNGICSDCTYQAADVAQQRLHCWKDRNGSYCCDFTADGRNLDELQEDALADNWTDNPADGWEVMGDWTADAAELEEEGDGAADWFALQLDSDTAEAFADLDKMAAETAAFLEGFDETAEEVEE